MRRYAATHEKQTGAVFRAGFSMLYSLTSQYAALAGRHHAAKL
jgi:hypothetical protein